MRGRRSPIRTTAIPVRSRTLIPAAAGLRAALGRGGRSSPACSSTAPTLQLVLGAAGVLATVGAAAADPAPAQPAAQPRAHRRAHRAAPTTAASTRRSRPSSTAPASAATPLAARAARPRQLQAGQRGPRASLRRRGPARGRRRAARRGPARRTAPHGSAATSSGSSSPGATRTPRFEVAERARAAVAAIPVHGFQLSCSAGLAAFPERRRGPRRPSSSSPTSALYWAKRGGKRRTRRFDPEHAPATWTDRQRAEVEELLALDRPIDPVFQPVVSLATGRVVGFEALARFAVAHRAPPDVWFAQAHGCGLGAELEAAAIRAALEPLGPPARDPPGDQRQPLGARLRRRPEKPSRADLARDRGRDHRARVRPRRRPARGARSPTCATAAR